jgi:hypothetical protein
MRRQHSSATGLTGVANVLRSRIRRSGAGARRKPARPRIVGLAAVLSCAALAGPLAASPALALTADGNGNYTQILCANPSSEEGLGISGMPEGLSNPASIDTWQVSTSEVNCASGHMTPNRGVPMTVGQSNTYAQGTWSALLYEAPANVTINGGEIYRAERAEGANDGFMGINQQGGEYNVLYSLPRNSLDQGDWFSGNVASRGTFSWPFSPENIVNLTISPDGGHWDVNATCDPNGNNNSSCTLTGGQWEYRIFGGEMSLNASKDPQASNISGPLSTDSPLRGTEPITFSATDEGPGLAYMKTLVDGNVVQSQIVDTNGGRCVSVPGHDAYTWAYQVPCKTSIGGRTYELPTTLVADGSHHVQVIIEDAAGNQSIVLDRTVDTSNAPVNATAPAVLAPSELAPGAALSAEPGAWSAPSAAGSISDAYQWQKCNIEGSGCTAIAGAESSTYDATASDIGHTLRVQVTAADRDGSATAVSGASSGVLSVLQSSTGPTGGTPTVDAPNGSGASEHAQLHLHVPAAVARSFAQRALRIAGSLANAQGQPISGAQLQVLEQPAGSPAAHVIGQVSTSSAGAFTASVPGGPSRLIEIGYRAFSADAGYAAAAYVHESVAAGVQLSVTPRVTAATGRIVLSGSVQGPVPAAGALVELLVRYRGHWEPFRTPHTTRTGRFRVVYQFEGAVGRFPFMARVPAGQAGLPYATGRSAAVKVLTG